MASAIELECPHCEALMVCEYEMDQGEEYFNMGLTCSTYWYLAWLDLPEKCPDGCALTAEDRAKIEEKTERRLLEPDDPG